MNAKEYIKTELKIIADKFPLVRFSYYFDELYDQHVILISPDFAYSSEKFAKAQIDFELAFVKEFPYESIFFAPKGEIEAPVQFDFELNKYHLAPLLLKYDENFLSITDFAVYPYEVLNNDPLVTLTRVIAVPEKQKSNLNYKNEDCSYTVAA